MLKKSPLLPGMKRIFLCGSPCSADSGCKPGAAKWTKASTVHGSCGTFWNIYCVPPSGYLSGRVGSHALA